MSDRPSALLGNQAMFTLTVDGCDDELRVVGFAGTEAISALFEFRVKVASATLPLDSLVGKPAHLVIDGRAGVRHIDGIVAEADYTGESSSYTLHEFVLVPSLWRLTQREGCRIFQGQTTPQILASVLDAAGIPRARYRLQLQAPYAPRDYCVQYRETDLAFISRLMEADGMHYYFEHTDDRHVLVISDFAEGGAAIAEDPRLTFTGARERECLSSFRLGEALRPARVVVGDHNLHAPDQTMRAEAGTGDGSEIFAYPAGFQRNGRGGPETGGQQAKLRLEALRASRRRGRGESDCPRLTPGFLFKVADDARAHLEGEYRLVRVEHDGKQPQALDEAATGEFSYSNKFECVDRRLPYRPPRATPRPTVQGVQTATVVGAEEIHVDEHGRVKVLFHWDRRDASDESSSCWVRVSQAWAGNGFGAMFLPRVGHEVIVDFIEGDPDRPIITGRIYTGINTPPYPLPDEKTKSTIKSESSPGGGGSNELRFEDAKGREEIYLHGQKDWQIVIEHDKTQTVGHDESLAVTNDRTKQVGHDEHETIAHDRTIRVGNTHVERIGGDMSIGIAGGLTETVDRDATFTVAGDQTGSIGANKAETVGATSTLAIGGAFLVTVGGAMNEAVGLAKTEEIGVAKLVNVGQTSSESVGGGKSVTAGENITESAGKNIALSAGKHVNATAGENVNIAAGKKAGLVAADQVTIQCGEATITIKKNGDITIQAKKLRVKASGEVAVKGSKIKLN